MYSKQHTLRLTVGAMLWNITPHKIYMMQQANQPTNQPTNYPTDQPPNQPTNHPTNQPPKKLHEANP